MAKLLWDQTGERLFETGTSHGALYVYDSATKQYKKGVAWNGLTAVTERPEGAEATDLYADDIKYATLRSAETFKGTIEAYTYPDEFMACDGSVNLGGVIIGQQKRAMFAMAYKTLVGSDADPSAANRYKLHIIYGCTCSPSEKAYSTVNDSPEAITFSWEMESTPVTFTYEGVDYATSTVVLDSETIGADKMKLIEDALFGTESAEPTMKTPDEIMALIA